MNKRRALELAAHDASMRFAIDLRGGKITLGEELSQQAFDKGVGYTVLPSSDETFGDILETYRREYQYWYLICWRNAIEHALSLHPAAHKELPEAI